MKKVALGILTSCLLGCTGPALLGPSSGNWRATYAYEGSTAAVTSSLFEISFSADQVSGWRYGCDPNWVDCAPKGYGLALSGTASEFWFNYATIRPTDPSVEMRIKGTFTSTTFKGTFKESIGSKSSNGTITMVWVGTKR